MTAIGFPKNRTQFSEFKSNTSNTPSTASSPSNDIGDVQKPTSVNAFFLMQHLLFYQIKIIQ